MAPGSDLPKRGCGSGIAWKPLSRLLHDGIGLVVTTCCRERIGQPDVADQYLGKPLTHLFESRQCRGLIFAVGGGGMCKFYGQFRSGNPVPALRDGLGRIELTWLRTRQDARTAMAMCWTWQLQQGYGRFAQEPWQMSSVQSDPQRGAFRSRMAS